MCARLEEEQMRVCPKLRAVIFASLALLLISSTGCGSDQDQRQRDEKTRQAAADAAAKVKPALKEAGRDLKRPKPPPKKRTPPRKASEKVGDAVAANRSI